DAVRVGSTERKPLARVGARNLGSALADQKDELVFECERVSKSERAALFRKTIVPDFATPEPFELERVGVRPKPKLMARQARSDERPSGLEAAGALATKDEARERIGRTRLSSPEQAVPCPTEKRDLTDARRLRRGPDDDERGNQALRFRVVPAR